MKTLKFLVLLLSAGASGIYKTTHAELVNVEINNTTASGLRENKTIIELNKDITVNTGLNLSKTLAELNGTEASNIPRIRKVTHVDNDSLLRKLKNKVNATEVKNITTPTTVAPSKVDMILTEAGVIAIKDPAKNITTTIPTTTDGSNSNNKTELKENQDNKNNTGPTPANKPSPSANITITTSKPRISAGTTLSVTNITSPSQNASISNGNSNSSSAPTSTASTSTTTTTATTTTTTTTTPKPKKPTITYSVPDFPDLEKDNPELNNLIQSSASNKLPIPDGPYAQPSQEFNGNFHRGRDFILPIVSMIFIIPLVIGILITSYRRFRDCWSTRHYRRMDFLVDGMYND